MAGSGIANLLGMIFGSHAVDKILPGHVFSRCIRGHFLIHKALGSIFMRETGFSEKECAVPVPHRFFGVSSVMQRVSIFVHVCAHLTVSVYYHVVPKAV